MLLESQATVRYAKRIAKTGLSLCSTDRNGDSAAGSACAGLGKFYNL